MQLSRGLTFYETIKLGPEQQRRALVRIFGFTNAQKAYTGMFTSLSDEGFMKRR